MWTWRFSTSKLESTKDVLHAFSSCRLIWLIGGLIAVAAGHSQLFGHHRYQDNDHVRKRRQAFGALDPSQTVELNFSVPFIFSARTYAYGTDRGDFVLDPNQYSVKFALRHPLWMFSERFTMIYITRDGVILFSDESPVTSIESFPRGPKAIAPYWAPVSLGKTGRVYYRETIDDNVLSLASNEVQIQYGYPVSFKPDSVVVVTWDNVAPQGARKDLSNNDRNMFQVALILSNNGSFAHMVYSKLRWHGKAIAGFNQGNGYGHFSLPGSGTPQVMLLANESDIGIPGEWMFKIDAANIALCGPGYKGLECINKCAPGEWSYDCRNRCHCANKGVCNVVNGHCPRADPMCEKGWENPPACDHDADECELSTSNCAGTTPDCINTPGSYICTCLTGLNNSTRTCRGGHTLTVGKNGGQQNRFPNSNEIIEVNSTPRQPIVQVVTRPPGSENGVAIVPQRIGHGTPHGANPSGPQGLRPGPDVAHAAERPLSTEIRPHEKQRILSREHQKIPDPATPPPEPVLPPEPDPPSVEIEPDRTIEPPNPTVILPEFTITAGTEEFTGCNLECGERGHCQILQGDPTCICDRGWSGDGIFCADINECFIENACVGNARCQNTEGGYNCLCEDGFKAAGDQCVDIDECAEALVACPGGNTSHCVNTHGGYECRCRTGYNGNPTSILGCIDINECLIPEFYCGPNANCENSLAAYHCHCFNGFVHNNELAECVDIDECDKDPCARAAVCRNTPGSFECTCLEGYAGNGFKCSETILYPYSRYDDAQLPQENDAVIEVPLMYPVKFLDNEYKNLFVSSNGIITFDQKLEVFREAPLEQLGVTGIAPLYEATDMTKGGAVYVKQTTDPTLLLRSSLNIQEDFNEPTFSAQSVTIVTYEHMLTVDLSSFHGGGNRNTFQVIIATGEAGTYVTYIYEELNSDKAQAGIISSSPETTINLPGSGENVKPLAETSNVGLQGKWIFRTDLSQVISCPAGYTGPPYCLTDIDECSAGLSRCHKDASCTNYAGSYGCACNEAFSGDGVQCVEVDPCLNNGFACHEKARCIIRPVVGAACICVEGYDGNGIQCERVTTTTEITTTPPTTTTRPTSTTPFQRPILPGRPKLSGQGPKQGGRHPQSGRHPSQGPVETEQTTFKNVFHLGGPSHGQPQTPSTSRRPAWEPTPNPEYGPFHPGQAEPAYPLDNSIAHPEPIPQEPEYPLLKLNPPPNSVNNQNPQIRHRNQPPNNIPNQSPPKQQPGYNRNYNLDNNNISPNNDNYFHGQSRRPPNTQTREEEAINRNSIARARESDLTTKRPSQPGSNASSSLLVIVIPAVLCGVWLILIVILLVVCLRKRKQRQRAKYGLGYYMAPSQIGSAKNGTSGTGTGGLSTPQAGSYAAATYGSHQQQSQWTIPRVVNYDYNTYQPGYYASDPYAPYKY